MSELNSITKPTLKWCPAKCRNPKTGEELFYPRLIDKEIYDAGRLVNFAMQNGYVHGGQYHSNLGLFNGVMQAARSLIFMGADVKLASWMRYHTEMCGKGAYDSTQGQLKMGALKLNVRAQMLEDFKLSPSDFNFERADWNIIKPYVGSLQSLGWLNNREIIANTQIAVSGSRLDYTSGVDTITAMWTEKGIDGEAIEKSVELTPDSAGSKTMILGVNETLSAAPVGTLVKFVFRLGGGNDSKINVIPTEYTAKVVEGPASNTPPTPLGPAPRVLSIKDGSGTESGANTVQMNYDLIFMGENLANVSKVHFDYKKEDGSAGSHDVTGDFITTSDDTLTLDETFWMEMGDTKRDSEIKATLTTAAGLSHVWPFNVT